MGHNMGFVWGLVVVVVTLSARKTELWKPILKLRNPLCWEFQEHLYLDVSSLRHAVVLKHSEWPPVKTVVNGLVFHKQCSMTLSKTCSVDTDNPPFKVTLTAWTYEEVAKRAHHSGESSIICRSKELGCLYEDPFFFFLLPLFIHGLHIHPERFIHFAYAESLSRNDWLATLSIPG